MKTLLRIARTSHFAFALLLILGVAAWFVATATIGEHYATAVGPDWLIKLPVAVAKLAVILALSRWMISHRFPTIHAFTQPNRRLDVHAAKGIGAAIIEGVEPESEFARVWRHPLQNGHDPRLGITIATYLGVHLIVALIVLFAF